MKRPSQRFRALHATAAAACVFALAVTANAEQQPVVLPAVYADFAINPDTGAIAAIDPQANTVTLFRPAYFRGDKSAMAGPQRVGAMPSSIVLKHFGDKNLFAVVCKQDANLFLFDAASLELVKKIPLGQGSVHQVTASLNSKDPFVYYSYGAGWDARTGAVDLRAMIDRGPVFDSAAECALSASGTIAYRRSGRSQAGFESLALASSLASEKPIFVQAEYNLTAAGQLLPDPFDQYLAAGHLLLARDLTKQVAKFEFTPQAFFTTRPWIVGVAGLAGSLDGSTDKPRICAASYNSLTAAGTPVPLPPAMFKDPRPAAARSTSADPTKTVSLRQHLFADDKRQQVVCAFGNQLLVTPLADLELPDEPVLQVRVGAPTELHVGRKYLISLEKADPRIKLSVDSLPDGAKETPAGVEWTPGVDQVGPASLALTLRFGDLDRQQTTDFTVSHPSIDLPFTGQQVLVDAEAQTAAVMDGPSHAAAGTTKPSESYTVAIVDLKKMAIVAQKKMTLPFGAAALTKDRLLLAAKDSNATHVFSAATLDREKIIYSDAPTTKIAVIPGKWVVLTSSSSSTRFTLPQLERAPTADAKVPLPQLTPGGLLVGGVLYDASGGKPQLLAAPGAFLALGSRDAPASDRSGFEMRFPARSPRPAPATAPSTETADTATVMVRTAPVSASVENHVQSVEFGGHMNRLRSDLVLLLADTSGGAIKKRVLLASTMLLPAANRAARPQIQAALQTAVVLHGDRLYRFDADQLAADEFPAPAALKQVQTTFVVPSEGKTTLTHEAIQGKSPLEFSLVGAPRGLEIDHATGTVTADSNMLLNRADAMLFGRFVDSPVPAGSTLVGERLKQYVTQVSEAFTQLAGKPPSGVPVAVPIQVRVQDAEGKSASLDYFVLVEASAKPVMEMADLKAAEWAAQLQAAQKPPALPPLQPAERTGPTMQQQNEQRREISELRLRVQTQEARLDIVTRQLNLVIRLLQQLENYPY